MITDEEKKQEFNQEEKINLPAVLPIKPETFGIIPQLSFSIDDLVLVVNECLQVKKPNLSDKLAIKQLTLTRQKAKSLRLKVAKDKKGINEEILQRLRSNNAAAKELIELLAKAESHCKVFENEIKKAKDLIAAQKKAEKQRLELEARLEQIKPFTGHMVTALDEYYISRISKEEFSSYLTKTKDDFFIWKENSNKLKETYKEKFVTIEEFAPVVKSEFDKLITGTWEKQPPDNENHVFVDTVPELTLTDPEAPFNNDVKLMKAFESKITEVLILPKFETDSFKSLGLKLSKHIKSIQEIILTSFK